MNVIDNIKQTIKCKAVIIPAKALSKLKGEIVKLPIKSVYSINEVDKRHILGPTLDEVKLVLLSNLTPFAVSAAIDCDSVPCIDGIILSPSDSLGHSNDSIDTSSETTVAGKGIYNAQVTLSYQDLNYFDSITQLIPLQPPTSYEQVGHIARFTLKPELIPYQSIIAKVVLDKNHLLKTIVNKTTNISDTYRTSNLSLMGGINNFVVKLKESNCTFEFDYSKVYWNSRLQTEHLRLVNLISETVNPVNPVNPVNQTVTRITVMDVFAGVGPFAIPLGKKCTVIANDLNPDSYKYLLHNIKLNKLENKCFAYNLDGREFIKSSIQFANQRLLPGNAISDKGDKANKTDMQIDHYIMNLPDSSIDFLDTFNSLSFNKQPMIHIYAFSKESDPGKDIFDRVEAIVGKLEEYSLHHVRNVAPKKEMMCLSFRLPKN
jgi:tRNA (guanine37-N1)-methyltransferase